MGNYVSTNTINGYIVNTTKREMFEFRVRCPQESDGFLSMIATGVAGVMDLRRQFSSFERPTGWDRGDIYEKKLNSTEVEASDIQRYLSEGYTIRERVAV